jgi:hypothetical protein
MEDATAGMTTVGTDPGGTGAVMNGTRDMAGAEAGAGTAGAADRESATIVTVAEIIGVTTAARLSVTRVVARLSVTRVAARLSVTRVVAPAADIAAAPMCAGAHMSAVAVVGQAAVVVGVQAVAVVGQAAVVGVKAAGVDQAAVVGVTAAVAARAETAQIAEVLDIIVSPTFELRSPSVGRLNNNQRAGQCRRC